MTGLDLLEITGNIDPVYVKEASNNRKKTNHTQAVRWIAAAAACVMVVASVPFIADLLSRKGGPGTEDIDGPDSLVEDIHILEYCGAYYEVTNIPEALTRYGLPAKLSEENVGTHVAYLNFAEPAEYSESIEKTGIEMFTYAQDPCSAVYIVNDSGSYYAAHFCNYILLNDSASVELSNLFQAYHISSASDIRSVSEVDWNRDKEVGPPVTSESAIISFYDACMDLTPYSNNDFQAEMFESIAEEKQIELHQAFANDLRILRVETNSGLYLFLHYYPNYGWLEAPGCLSYYPAGSTFAIWADAHVK